MTGGYHSSPSVAPDGTIYVGSYVDGQLYAISPAGTTNWTYPAGAPIDSSPSIAGDGTIYFGSGEKLYALNPNGTKKWDFACGQSGQATASISGDGTVYIGTQTNRLWALHPDGTQKWAFDAPGPIECSPAIGSDGSIYVTVQSFASVGARGIIAVSNTGGERWRNLSEGFFSSPVVGADGTVYAVTWMDDRLEAINPTNVLVDWRAGTGSNPFLLTPAPAAARDGTVYYTPVQGYTNLYAINADGTTNWTLVVPSYPATTSPTVGPDGTVYFAAAATLYAVKGTAPLANSPWPKYKQNLRNTGKVEKPSLKQPQKRSDGGFQFKLQGELGQGYTIQASANLNAWTSLTSFLATTVPMDIVDSTATNFPVRFYRASSP